MHAQKSTVKLAWGEITDMHVQSTSFSPFAVSIEEQAIVIGKRLKDAVIQWFAQQGWGNAMLASPLKRLKTGIEKCILEKENRNIKLENSVDSCHVEHVCDGNVTNWKGIQSQSPTFCHHVELG